MIYTKYIVVVLWRIFWSLIFRLLMGRGWFNKIKNYDKLELLRHAAELALIAPIIRKRKWIAYRRLSKDIIVATPFDFEIGFILREVFVEEVYEKVRQLGKSDVVIDVGAHVGLFTLKAVMKGSAKVVSIEPHPVNYKFLTININIAGISSQVIPVKLALSNSKGYAKLCTDRLGASGVATIKASYNRFVCFNVPTETLDDLLVKLGLSDKVTFIKIDVEGAELEVLQGANKILEKGDIYVAVAAYHYPSEYLNVARYLKGKGFKVFSDGSYVYACK